MSSTPSPPHGGALVALLADAQQAEEVRRKSRDWPSWDMTPRQICDLELLMTGGFSPLRGFLSRADYQSVCDRMRLADGTIWPIPIVLDVSEEVAKTLKPGQPLGLRDQEGVLLAVLHVQDVWLADRMAEAQQVYGTTSAEHPGVAALLRQTLPWYVGGAVQGIQTPRHYDFLELRLSPAQVRRHIASAGWQSVVAFQTRNPIHRAHHELTLRAMEQLRAGLLVHPVVGMTKPGDVDHYTRVRCYQAVMKYYPHGAAALSLLPLAMRMAGPREALWHAIIRKNHGCSHFIVGRDHAGPGADSTGKPFYGPYDAQELVRKHERELGIGMVPFKEMVYVKERDHYVPSDEVPSGMTPVNISGAELRRLLSGGHHIPAWFSFPEVLKELRRTYPSRHKLGFTVFFTGLPSSGKSTLANVLMVRFLEIGGRKVTLLDGDIVRKNLSSELGFSREHRDLNIRRIGFVAAEITKNGGIAICAPIAPYDVVRKDVRHAIEPEGGFILVHVATPLDVCEQRDRKGLYAKARAGIVKGFTGISDPYEKPTDAELTIDTTRSSPEECVQTILQHLRKEGFITPEAGRHSDKASG